MSNSNVALETYVTGLRNQHAVETQAIGTIQNELTRMQPYPELAARMKTDKEQAVAQAARLDGLLDKHGTSKSLAKEAVSGIVGTVAGFAHVGSADDMLKNVLAAVGFKAYEIGSYKALLAMAEAAGVAEDKAVLEQSLKEEEDMGAWLHANLPDLVRQYLRQKSA